MVAVVEVTPAVPMDVASIRPVPLDLDRLAPPMDPVSIASRLVRKICEDPPVRVRNENRASTAQPPASPVLVHVRRPLARREFLIPPRRKLCLHDARSPGIRRVNRPDGALTARRAHPLPGHGGTGPARPTRTATKFVMASQCLTAIRPSPRAPVGAAAEVFARCVEEVRGCARIESWVMQTPS